MNLVFNDNFHYATRKKGERVSKGADFAVVSCLWLGHLSRRNCDALLCNAACDL